MSRCVVSFYIAGMLSLRGQYGLEAKFCGLGLVLGLVKHWPRSHVSWPRGLNSFFMWYIKWKISMSLVRKTTVSWTSSAVAKGYYLLKCLAMLIQSGWCRFYDMICNMKVICIYMLHDSLDIVASASYILASASHNFFGFGLGLILLWPH